MFPDFLLLKVVVNVEKLSFSPHLAAGGIPVRSTPSTEQKITGHRLDTNAAKIDEGPEIQKEYPSDTAVR